jgi:hypothetical protein
LAKVWTKSNTFFKHTHAPCGASLAISCTTCFNQTSTSVHAHGRRLPGRASLSQLSNCGSTRGLLKHLCALQCASRVCSGTYITRPLTGGGSNTGVVWRQHNSGNLANKMVNARLNNQCCKVSSVRVRSGATPRGPSRAAGPCVGHQPSRQPCTSHMIMIHNDKISVTHLCCASEANDKIWF